MKCPLYIQTGWNPYNLQPDWNADDLKFGQSIEDAKVTLKSGR